jgi:hypothetical protein
LEPNKPKPHKLPKSDENSTKQLRKDLEGKPEATKNDNSESAATQ